MEYSNKYLDQIDDYLLGHLKEAEAEEFRRQLLTDGELAKAVASQERILKGMTVGGRREIKKELKNIHQELFKAEKGKTKIVKFNWRPLLAAASVLFLGILSWWLWTPDSNSPEQIFADNYKPFNLILNQRDETQDSLIAQAVQLYRSGQYDQAIPILDTLAKKEENNAQVLMALAIARFESGAAASALAPLKQIIKNKDPFLSDLAKWYCGLFYIHLQQNENAIPYFQDLSDNPTADKHSEAKEILDQLL